MRARVSGAHLRAAPGAQWRTTCAGPALLGTSATPGNKKPGARAPPSSDEFHFQSYDNNTNKKEGKPTLTKGSARHDIVY